MFNSLVALGWGMVTFAIIIVIGMVVVGKLNAAVSGCNSSSPIYNTSSNTCVNASGTVGNTPSDAATAGYYLNGQLGQNGLASWSPAIIALAIGMLFIGAFMMKKGKQA
jgi:hypothetical protein